MPELEDLFLHYCSSFNTKECEPSMHNDQENKATTHKYGTAFYHYLQSGSYDAAIRMSSILLKEFQIDSVLDVGCGQGAWLAGWKANGVETVFGLDGDYVGIDNLLVEAEEFKAADLSKPFKLNCRFDLVQSLEVAEHIPARSSEEFVSSICNHGNLVLFSAAQPGQGGEHHINEKPLEFWRKLFAQHGFEAFDFVRPIIADDVGIRPWYRYNTVIYAHHSIIQDLTPNVLISRVLESGTMDPGGSLYWRLRRRALLPFPSQIITFLSKMNTRLSNILNKR